MNSWLQAHPYKQLAKDHGAGMKSHISWQIDGFQCHLYPLNSRAADLSVAIRSQKLGQCLTWVAFYSDKIFVNLNVSGMKQKDG
jgi:hypothetical protein